MRNNIYFYFRSNRLESTDHKVLNRTSGNKPLIDLPQKESNKKNKKIDVITKSPIEESSPKINKEKVTSSKSVAQVARGKSKKAIQK